MAEIDRPDLISDDAFKAPYELARSLGAVEEVLDEIIAKGGAHSTIIGAAKSTKELAKSSIELEQQQKKLQEAQKKVAESQKKVNQELEGGAEAVEALDDHTGGLIQRSKELGKQFTALAKNPWVLLIGVIVGALVAAGGAMKKFLTSTGEGEDILNRQIAVWDQFWNTIGKGVADTGKSIVGAFGEDGLQGLLFSILNYFSPKMAAQFLATSIQAKELADAIDDIEERRARNIVKRSETELKYNKLLVASEQHKKTNAEEARKILLEANDLKERQLLVDKKIAEDHAKAVLYSIGLEHDLSKAVVDKMTLTEMEAEFTGDQMVKIMEAKAAVIDLEAKYFQEIKKNTAKIITFDMEIHKEKIKLAEDELQAKVKIQKDIMDQEILAIQQAVIEGTKVKEDGDKEILAKKRAYADDLVRIEMDGLQKLLDANIFNAEERAVVEKRLTELKLAYNQALYDQINELEEITIESGMSQLEKIEQMYTDLAGGISSLFNSLTDNRLANLEREEEAVRKFYDEEIELAGDNVASKEALEKRFQAEQEKIEKKRVETMRRAAIFDKFTSAVAAGIATAVAVTKLLATPPLALAAGIAGAAQVAAILAKEIPQYKDGGRTTSGLIIAGEEGIEKYRTPSGVTGYTPGTATLMNLPVGTEILSHDKTMQELAMRGIGAPDVVTSSGGYDLAGSIKSLENAIKNKKELHVNFSRNGAEAVIRNAETRTRILNDLFN